MELIYVWIKEYKCIYRQGFCLSPEFTVKETVKELENQKEQRKLEIKYHGKGNLFQEKPIENLTVLVGENGSGKSTFLEYVYKIECCYEETLNGGHPDWGKNVTVVRDGKKILIYTNMSSSEIEIKCDVAPLKCEIVNRSKERKANIRHSSDRGSDQNQNNDYFGQVTKLYITNSYYTLINGSSSQERLDYLVFSPGNLSIVTDEFFQFICPDAARDRSELFWWYSRLLKDLKSTGGFQQLCDLLFYWHLIERKALKEYAGFIQPDLIFRASSVFSDLDEIKGRLRTEEEQHVFFLIKEVFDRVKEIYDKGCESEKPICNILKANFIAEYLLYHKDFLDGDLSGSIENIFEGLEEKLGNRTKGYKKNDYDQYFEEACDEICDFENLTEGLELCVSQMWLAGGEGKEGLKVSFDRDEEEPEKSQYAQICNFFSEKIRDNENIRKGKKKFGSFILRYILIDNLFFSSGERAFQNLMSWMFFGAELSKATVRESSVPRRKILLCIDEADLYCHPSWQRDFIDNLLTLIKTAYKGYSVQIIMTTHSPLCLSDVPGENIIYLKNEHGRTVVDQEEHRQTFGCNLYELLNDAFYLKNHTMGKFARKTINNLIQEINVKQGFSEQKIPELRKQINYIGDSFIRRKLEQQMEWQWQKQVEQRMSNAATDEQRLKMMEEEKNRLERQIEELKRKNKP